MICTGPSTFLGNTTIQGGNVLIKNSSVATNTTSGSLVVQGDVGIAGKAFISELIIDQNTLIKGNLFINGTISTTNQFQFHQITIRGTIPAPSTSINTGALIIPSGGAGISGNIHIGEQLYVTGNAIFQKKINSSAIECNTINCFSLTIPENGNFTCLGTYTIKSFTLSSNIRKRLLYFG
jgi:predicted acyltransferase (DUF342 family)